jgi:thiol-disulfide isomerase/thioredoxin
MRLIRLAVVLAVSLAIVPFAAIVNSACAGDDGELRRMVHGAGLVPYWSFKAVKEFSYPVVDTSRSVSIRELGGKVVVVNLWATWCPPCVKEMPSLQGLHEQFHPEGLTVLGINIRDQMEPQGVRDWLMKRNLTFLNLKGDRNGPPLVSNFYIPQTFIIDKRGRLIANKTGPHDWTDPGMQQLVRYMLAAD